jgi:putative PIN family toxin of toxin-antitoxin system
MRVLLDTNIYISYLLSSGNSPKSETIRAVIESAILGAYGLVFPAPLLAEITGKLTTKPYLAAHITKSDAEDFFSLIGSVCEQIPEITEPIPQVCRDADDNYLLAYALVGECDYLVTGDLDLLTLTQIEALTITNPEEFRKILQREE